MLEYKQGNLLESEAEALVNAVNCMGVMGKGIALQFKQAYPGNFEQYAAACAAGEMAPGRMLAVPVDTDSASRWIINFPTKRHWRGKSKLEDVRNGLAGLTETLRQHGIRSVAVPALGCGLGGLDWEAVKPLIETVAAELPEVNFEVYLPGGNTESAGK